MMSQPSTTTQPPSASLYVGDLSLEISEAILFEIFGTIGAVASIRVCRDTVTRRSLGYAYVNYHNVGDAERALETLNFTPIPAKGGRPCRIMWSERDPSRRKNGVGNVFVKNLDKSIDNKLLHDTFSMFGDIVSVKVATSRADGTSLGYGFVHFANDEAGARAIEKVNGKLLGETVVTVEAFKPAVMRQPKSATFNNVYVKNLPESFTQEQLETKFAFGPIERAALRMKTAEDGSQVCAGFGFVCYLNPEHAVAAINALNGEPTGEEGKELYVGRAQKKIEREKELKDKFDKIREEKIKQYAPGCNLYVKNLADSVTEAALLAEFGKYGNITSAKIMMDPNTHISKGFGFVCFDSSESATKAVTEANKKMFEGMPLYVGLAMRREVRRSHLEQQFAQARMKNQGMGPNMMNMGMGNPMYPPYAMPFNPAMAQGRGYMQPYNMMMAQGMPNQGRGPMTQGTQGRQNGPMMQFQQQQQRAPANVQFNGMANNMAVNPQMLSATRGAGRGPATNVRPQQPMTGMPQSKPLASPTRGTPMGTDQAFLNTLATAAPEQQKQMIGEKLYPIVERSRPALAGKITGMLLEIENAELLHLLENSQAMEEKINEAVHVLQEAGEGQA